MITSNYQQIYFPSNVANTNICTELGEIVTNNGKNLAIVDAYKMEWDTNILSKTCARIKNIYCKDETYLDLLDKAFNNVTTKMDNAIIDFCDFRTGMHDFRLIHLAEKYGFRLMDIMNIYLSYDSPKLESTVNALEELHYRFSYAPHLSPIAIDQAAEIARNSFTNSRLYQDPRITKEVADHFYRELLLTFIASEDSHVGIAFDENGNVAGFFIGQTDFSVELRKRIGYLWLIAVSPAHHGKGLGKNLLNRFLAEMHSFCDFVEIGTQVTNLAANHLYQAAGLRVVANVATFHRWHP